MPLGRAEPPVSAAPLADNALMGLSSLKTGASQGVLGGGVMKKSPGSQGSCQKDLQDYDPSRNALFISRAVGKFQEEIKSRQADKANNQSKTLRNGDYGQASRKLKSYFKLHKHLM